jgi:predicted AlkP superfamily pyrophosphatase or phosphodiesterase
MVSIDGLRADALAGAAPPPVLASLAAAGTRARALRPVFPSVTWPCHTTLVTGVGPARHGVLGNHVYDRARGDVVEHYGDRTDVPVAVPTLWDRVAASGGAVAALCWPKTRGVAAIADNIPEFYDQALFEAHASPGLWRELTARGLAVQHYGAWSACHAATPMQDWLTLEAARHLLAARPPRLLLVHFLTLDSFQHDHGVDSPEARWALAHADALLGRLVETLDATGLRPTTALAVFGDHGFVDVATTHHLNQVLCEEGLVELDARGGVARRRAWAAGNGGSAYVYVLDGAPATTLARLRERFGALAGVSVLDADALDALGLPAAHPAQGDLVLAADDGVLLTGHATPEAAAAAPRYRAGHGHSPLLPGLGAGLVLEGPGVRDGATLGEVSMLDVAPTLAQLLGVDLPDAEGAPLVEALSA